MIVVVLLQVVAGGFAGGVARYLLTELVTLRLGGRFPWGTLIVNASGCFAIGAVAALVPPAAAGGVPRDVLIYGLLGGYTTVSSLALQSLELIERGEAVKGVLNIGASALLCVATAAAGLWVGAALPGGAGT